MFRYKIIGGKIGSRLFFNEESISLEFLYPLWTQTQHCVCTVQHSCLYEKRKKLISVSKENKAQGTLYFSQKIFPSLAPEDLLLLVVMFPQ